MKKGISLIVLVITIIVIVILAGAVILSISQNNPINSASEATFKSCVSEYSSELTLYLSKNYALNSAFNPNNINARIWDGSANTTGTVKEYIPSMKTEDANKFVIYKGKLVFVGTDSNQKNWATNLAVTGDFVRSGLLVWFDAVDFINSPQSTVWIDRSGNGYNAIPVNIGYTTTSGNTGNGTIKFDGTNDYFRIPYNTELAPTSAITVMCTIDTDWTQTTRINPMSKTQIGGYNITLNEPTYSPGCLAGIVYRNGTFIAAKISKTLLSGTVNACTTYDGRYTKLYINGSLVDTNDAGANYPIVYTNANDFIIGAEAGPTTVPEGGYFNGTIKSMLVYNRALTDSEVLQNYKASM